MSSLRPTAPTNLAMPNYVSAWLGRPEQTVLGHGFAEKKLALRWWKGALTDVGLGAWEVTVDPLGSGATELTRGTLFALGKQATDDDSTFNFLLHVLAWGSGTGSRNNRRRLAAFAEEDTRHDHLELLQAAARIVRSDDPDAPRRAYGTLIRRGGGVIPALGPAFFTKFLYFAGAGEGSIPCLILDARVASSLYEAGWTDLPHSARKNGYSFSYNWYTDTYVSYCELLKRWADAQGSKTRSDEIERALFAGSDATPPA